MHNLKNMNWKCQDVDKSFILKGIKTVNSQNIKYYRVEESVFEIKRA